jgi:drug/metabolite transporter (DMT)-like permease
MRKCNAGLSEPDQTAKLTQLALLFILGSGWGLQFTLLKIATDADLDEFGIVTVSMVLIAAFCLLAMAWRKAWFRPTRRHLRFFLIGGLFGFAAPLTAVVLAAEHLSAGLIVFCESLTPVLTVAIALAMRTEALTMLRVAAIALGMLGAAVVLWPELIMPEGGRTVCLLIALTIPVAYAIDGIYVVTRRPADLSSLQVVSGQVVAGAAVLLILSYGLGGWQPLAMPFGGDASSGGWGAGEWAILVFVPVTCFEIFLYFHLLRSAGAVFVSAGSFVSLFAGVFWGMALLGEQHPSSIWLAVVLVAAALGLINSGQVAPAASSGRRRLGLREPLVEQMPDRRIVGLAGAEQRQRLHPDQVRRNDQLTQPLGARRMRQPVPVQIAAGGHQHDPLPLARVGDRHRGVVAVGGRLRRDLLDHRKADHLAT